MFTTLIEVPQLAAILSRPGLAVLDCRFELADPDRGAAEYAKGHIPTAQYAHLERDLSGERTPQSGRHPLPDPERLALALGRWGINASMQVVAYDQGPGAYAARAWWILRWLGHEAVAVLNGGFAAWNAAGLPIETHVQRRDTRLFVPEVVPERQLPVAELAPLVGASSTQLIDARSADRFAGENETMDPVAGHVPGARNHPFTTNLGPDGRFLAPAELRARWEATLAGRPASEVIAMCGSGVTACHNLLALEHAGLKGGRLYPGSWSEWIRDPARPIAKGPA